MAVAETATSQGKAGERPARGGGMPRNAGLAFGLHALAGAALLSLLPLAQAQIVPDMRAPASQRATVLTTGSANTPLVNIQTPSAAGVSRNTYSQFDVNGNGVVLNNSRTNTATQTGGWVQGNPWLATGGAKVILNEVNSANPSQLRGAIEVAGQRAEVVIANPAGIHVDGAGFINTSRATLTTGTPIVNAANGGSLDGYRVQGGIISFNGAGLDARSTDSTAILARAVQVNAGIWAQQLSVVTGANEVRADSSAATPTNATDAAPAFALDVAAIGGMYAGKITLVGTEAGLGVRNAGALQAHAGDLVLDHNGWLSNSGSVYASGHTTLQTAGSIGNTGLIAAQGHTTLTSGGAISSDQTSVLAAGLNGDNRLGGSGQLRVSAVQEANLQGQTVAGNDVMVGGSAVNLAEGQVSGTNVNISAATGDVNATGATLAAAQTLSLQAAQTLRTDGANVSAGQLAVQAQALSNVGGKLIQTGGADLAVNLAGPLNNSGGTIASNGRLALAASALDNTRGSVQSTTGNVALNVAHLNNTSGQVTAGADLSIEATTVDNSGTLYASGQQTMTASGVVANSGVIAAAGNTRVNAPRFEGSSTSLLAAGLKADGSLGTAGELRVAATQTLAAHGRNMAAGDVVLRGTALDVSGSQTSGKNLALAASAAELNASKAKLQATQNLNASSSQTSRTDGATVSAEKLELAARDLSNVGGTLLQTGTEDLRLQLPGTLNNSGGTIASKGRNLNISAGVLDNTAGEILHAGSGVLSLDANTLSGARGQIQTSHELDLRASQATLDGANTSAEKLTIRTDNLSNRAGQILQTGLGATQVTATTTLDNTGGVIASRGHTAVSARDVFNRGGSIQAAESASLSLVVAGTLDNTAKGNISASGAASVQANRLNNQTGQVSAGASLAVNTTQAIDNREGLIAATGDTNISSASLDNQQGRIAAVQGALNVVATEGGIHNEAGKLQAGQNVQLVSNGLLNADGLVAGAAVSINTRQHELHNAGGTVSANGTLDVQSGALNNSAGLIQAKDALQINTHGQTLRNTSSGTTGGISGQSSIAVTTGALDNTGGFIGAAGPVTATATNAAIANASGSIASQKGVVLNAAEIDNAGGQLQALGSVSLTVTGASGLRNSSGLVRAGENLTAAAARIDNSLTAGKDQGLEGGSVALLSDDVDNSHGSIRADESVRIAGAGQLNNSGGLVSSVGSLTVVDSQASSTGIKSQSVLNTGGTLIAGKQLALDSATLSSDGKVLSRGDLNVKLQGDYAQEATAQLQAAGNAKLEFTGTLTNRGQLLAGQNLTVKAAHIHNTSNGEISAANTVLQADGEVSNRGVVDSNTTFIEAKTLHNTGTGRIYGDHVALQVDTLTNDAETTAGVTRAGTVAARERLDIGTTVLHNQEHALLFSAGDLAIGGVLDANRQAVGQARALRNGSASIESLGNLNLNVAQIDNTNNHLQTEQVQVGSQFIQLFEGAPSIGDPNWLRNPTGIRYEYKDLLRFETGEVDIIYLPEGHTDHFYRYDITRNVSETRIVNSDPGRIVAGGSLGVNAETLNNDSSHIIAGGALSVAAGSLNNQAIEGQRITNDSGEVLERFRITRSGRDKQGSTSTPYAPPDTVETMALGTTVYKANAQPDNGDASGTQLMNFSGKTVDVQATGRTEVQARIAGLANTGAIDQANNGLLRTLSVPSASLPSSQAPLTRAAAIQQVASSVGSLVRSVSPSTSVPTASLFRTVPNPGSHYLVETDPRFTNYRQWLSSDALLSALSYDPNTVQKRLGDGFYEQQLIREQVAELTGRRFLSGYASDDAQYQVLIASGVTYARQWQLRPGVALTAGQMAQLTTDIVWLVEQTVTLADGSTQQVLVPQLYAVVREGDLTPNGALLAGGAVHINLSGDLTNNGTILGRKVVELSAENVQNLGGRIQGDVAAVQARNDLNNIGGQISANNSLFATAGRDLNLETTTRSATSSAGGNSFACTSLDRIASLVVHNPGGTLVASAGRDLNLVAANVTNAGADGTTALVAGRNLNLSTITTASADNIAWNAKNWLQNSSSTEMGSTVQGAGAVRLAAGQDLNARAANVQGDGALTASAGRDLNVTAGVNTLDVAQAGFYSGRSGGGNKQSVAVRDSLVQTTSVASSLGGDRVTAVAGRDLSVQGSQLVSDNGTALAAGRNVEIVAAIDTQAENHFREEKKSGLMKSGGIGFTAGKQQQSVDDQSQANTAAASTIGALSGGVDILAGQHYRQVGSDVLATGADGKTDTANISIQAQDVAITEAREHSSGSTLTKQSSSGLTLAVGSPILSAVQTAQGMVKAAGQTEDTRMKALAGAAAGLNLYNNSDDIGKAASALASGNPSSAGSISVSVGGSKSQSTSSFTQDAAKGSRINAARNAQIVATGAGQNSNLLIQGGDLRAGNTATLQADNAIQLLAAQNTGSQTSSQSAKSGSIGLSLGANTGVTLAASQSKGQGNGSDTHYSNTQVSAGQQVALRSGGDTTLSGAVVAGTGVTAQVGGNLAISSLQDQSQWDAKTQSMGGSITIGPGLVPTGGGFSAGQTNVRSNFQSVKEQSGLKTGDGGFQVDVNGNTALTGGAITSTQAAVDQNLNRFSTTSLNTTDLHNIASYKGSGVGISANLGVDVKGDTKPGAGAGFGQDKGQASSTTQAAISGIAGNSAARTGDQDSGLKPIFDKDKVNAEVNAQVAITQAFGQQASQAVGTYAGQQAKALRDQGNEAEAQKWDEGGAYRVAAHAVVGGLSGGVAGAAGAAAGAKAAPTLNGLQDGLQSSLQQAGLSDVAAKAIAQGAGAAAATTLGAATGGAAGATTALNQDVNNRQLHGSELRAIALASNGDKEKEARLTRAACYAVKCWEQYPEGRAEREQNYVSALEMGGLTEEREWVNAQKNTTGMFGYTGWGSAKDSFTAGPLPLIQNGGKVVGGGLAILTGKTICGATGVGCVVGAPLAVLGASEVIEGGTGIYNSLTGTGKSGSNPVRIGLNMLWPVAGDTIYDASYLGLSVLTLGASVPFKVGATDGINRVDSMFGVTVPRWQNQIINPMTNKVLLPRAAAQGALLYGLGAKVPAIVDDVKKAKEPQ